MSFIMIEKWVKTVKNEKKWKDNDKKKEGKSISEKKMK